MNVAAMSHVKIPYFQRVLLDELAAGFDFVAHQDAEEVIGLLVESGRRLSEC